MRIRGTAGEGMEAGRGDENIFGPKTVDLMPEQHFGEEASTDIPAAHKEDFHGRKHL